MLLIWENGEPFTIGATPYIYQGVASDDSSPRVIIPVSIGDQRVSAFVDTGGVFLLFSPQIAASLQLDPKNAAPTPRLLSRGTWIKGALHRVSLTLLAIEGDSLTIEATAFVPQELPADWSDDFACVLGMKGCLDRVRFAIDPGQDIFYFGELASN